MKIYGNEITFILYDIALRLSLNKIKFWINVPKRYNKKDKRFVEVTFLNKGNLLKCRVFFINVSKFNYHFYYGTKLLCVSDTIRDYKLFI